MDWWFAYPYGKKLYYSGTSGGRCVTDAAKTAGVRPVISLVTDLTIKDGSGTESSPYRLNGIDY